MRSPLNSLVRLGLCLLVAFTFQPGNARAADGMSAEDEVLYKKMMESALSGQGTTGDTGADARSSRRWTEGKGIVHYHIVGEFQGRTDVIGDVNWIGYADVADRVVIDLDWKLTDAALLGTPAIQNAKSTVRNLRNYEPACQPPTLKGEYEHYELKAIKPGLAGALELQGQTSYPAADVVQSCSGSRKAVPASVNSRPEELVVPSPVMLGMALPDSDNLSISPDKKSLIQKKNGWTWTFTPSVKK